MPMNRNALTKGSASLATDKDSWIYETEDASTTTLVSGYFDEATQQFNLGDLITVKASDGTFLLKVDTEQGAVPCVASLFSTGGGGGLPDMAPLTVLANATAATAEPTAVPIDATISMVGGTLKSVLPVIGAQRIIANAGATPAVATSAPLGAGLSFVSGALTASVDLTGYMQKSANLSDVASAVTSRTNLGLGTVATKAASDNTKTTVPMISSFVDGDVAVFDSVGSLVPGGPPTPGTGSKIAVTSATQVQMVPGNEYICIGGFAFDLLLPTTMATNETIEVVMLIFNPSLGRSVRVSQNAGQQIFVTGNGSGGGSGGGTTVGVTGYIDSDIPGIKFTLYCAVADTEFNALNVTSQLTTIANIDIH